MSKEILEQVDIFCDIRPEKLEKIHAICQSLVYMQNEAIFYEGTQSKEFYIILEGEVEISVNPELVTAHQGIHKPGVIATLRQGQSFGEVALVDEGLRSASATCSSMKCSLLVINREDLLNLMRNDPEIGFQVMHNLALDLCYKIRQANLNLRQAMLYAPKEHE